MTIRSQVLVLGALSIAAGVMLRPQRVPAAAAVEEFCPGGAKPSPNVILCDDFEDHRFESQWDIGSNRHTWPPSDFVQCADDNFGFGSRCAAWTNKLVFDDAWGFYGYDARRSFPPQSELYVRWYQYISNPYTWGSLEDKSVILHDQANTISAYVATSRNHRPDERHSGPGMPFIANYQDLDWSETGGRYTTINRFQNKDRDITLQPGKWYLFEWYVKLNRPGVSDGIARLWIDDATQPIAEQTLRMEYTDMRWLKSNDFSRQFGVVRLTVYDQRCDGVPNTCPPNGPRILNQSHRWDRIVVSKAPIGALAQAPARPREPTIR